jgi:chemotaxis protein CheC
MLQRTFRISLPEILRGDGNSLFYLDPPPESAYIVMLMDLPSMSALKSLLAEFIERTAGTAPSPANA